MENYIEEQKELNERVRQYNERAARERQAEREQRERMERVKAYEEARARKNSPKPENTLDDLLRMVSERNQADRRHKRTEEELHQQATTVARKNRMLHWLDDFNDYHRSNGGR